MNQNPSPAGGRSLGSCQASGKHTDRQGTEDIYLLLFRLCPGYENLNAGLIVLSGSEYNTSKLKKRGDGINLGQSQQTAPELILLQRVARPAYAGATDPSVTLSAEVKFVARSWR